MTAPAHAWAIAQGPERQLLPADRLTLIMLADRGNCKRVCWPSLRVLMADTGLAKRTLLTSVHRLAQLGLIFIEKRGRGQSYHILRPAEDTGPEQNSYRSRHGAEQNSTRSNGANGANQHPDRSKIAPAIGAKCRPKTIRETKKKLSRAQAREEGKILDQGNGSGTPPPVAPPPAPPVQAPVLGSATNGGGSAYRPPGKQAATEPDPGNQPVDPGYALAVLANVQHALHSRNYPPLAAVLSAEEQIAAIAPKHGIGADAAVRLKWQPCEPLRTPEEQLAVLHAAMATERVLA